MLRNTYLFLFIFLIINGHLNISSASNNDLKDSVDDNEQITRVKNFYPIIIDSKREYRNLLKHLQTNIALIGLYLAEMHNIAECMANKNSHPIVLKTHEDLYRVRYEGISNLVDEIHYNNTLIFNPNRPVIKYKCKKTGQCYEIEPVNSDIKSLITLHTDINYESLMNNITQLQKYLTTTIEDMKMQDKSLKSVFIQH